MTIRQDYIDRLIALANEFAPHFGVEPPRDQMGAPDWLRAQQEAVKDGPLQPMPAPQRSMADVENAILLDQKLGRIGADGTRHGEMRAYTPSLGERTANAARDAAPYLPRTADRAITSAVDVGSELTGVPTALRGITNVERGVKDQDPLRVVAGVGEAAMSALPVASTLRTTAPAVRAVMASAPRAAGIAATTAVPSALMAARANAQGAPVEGLNERPLTIQERFPVASAVLPTVAASAAVPFAVQAARNLSTFRPWSTAGRLNSEIDAGQKAMAGGSLAERYASEGKLNAFLNERPQGADPVRDLLMGPSHRPSILDRMMPTLGAGALGATVGAVPDIVTDKDGGQIMRDAAAGAVAGVVGQKLGGLVPSQEPNWNAAQGVRDALTALRVRGASGGASTAHQPVPPWRSQSANGTGSPPPPPPNPGPTLSPPSPPLNAFAQYDRNIHGPISRQHIDDFLSRMRMSPDFFRNTPDIVGPALVQGHPQGPGLAERFRRAGVPEVDPGGLAKRAEQTADRLRDQDISLARRKARATYPAERDNVLNASTGKYDTLALPAAVGAAAAASEIKGHWDAQPRGDDGRFDGPPDPKKWKPRDE